MSHEAPPPYLDKAVDRMTSAERLRSLQAWAEEQKYVRPGEGGTLNTGVGGLRSLAFGGPMLQSSAYDKPLAPPDYTTLVGEAPKPKEKGKGRVGEWLKRRRERKHERTDEWGVQ